MALNNVLDRSERHIYRAARRFEQEITLVRRTDADDNEREEFRAILQRSPNLASADGDVGDMSVDLSTTYEIELMITKDNKLDSVDTSYDTNVTSDAVEINGFTYEVGDITESAYFQKIMVTRER